MKIQILIPFVIFLGLTVLFFFPEPESNFLFYFGTALFFMGLVIFLLFRSKVFERETKGC